MNHYVVPEQSVEVELEVKKSKFIASAGYAPTREQALEFVQRLKQKYPDARHHCWAYLLGNPSSAASAAMNDDGEPSGTAGKPILNVLQHKTIGDVIVVVTRYFGGIKLGAGGLIRAYSSAAEQAISSLQLTEKVSYKTMLAEMDFSQEQLIRHWLSESAGYIESVQYGEKVYMAVKLREETTPAFTEFCLKFRVGLEEPTD